MSSAEKTVGKSSLHEVHSSFHLTSKRKIKALLDYIVKSELMSSEATATAKVSVCLLKAGYRSDQCGAAAITTGQFVLALFTSQRSVRCPGGVLLMSQLAHVCISRMLIRAGAGGHRPLFTPLNISWRMNTRRMRDRVNIAVKIKR